MPPLKLQGKYLLWPLEGCRRPCSKMPSNIVEQSEAPSSWEESRHKSSWPWSQKATLSSGSALPCQVQQPFTTGIPPHTVERARPFFFVGARASLNVWCPRIKDLLKRGMHVQPDTTSRVVVYRKPQDPWAGTEEQ